MFGHVRWFVDENNFMPVDPLTTSEIFLVLGAIVTCIVFLSLLSRMSFTKGLNKKSEKFLKPLGEWVPTIIRISFGLVLILNAWQGYLFAPNILVEPNLQEPVTWLLAGLGAMLVLGIYPKFNASLVMSVYAFSYIVIEPLLLLEHLEYLAIGIYIAIAGGGKLMLSSSKRDWPNLKAYGGQAVKILRIGVGMSLIILALSEKLLNLDIAQQFLSTHDWNVLSFAGVSDRWFIIIAGISEMIIGLSFVFNLAVRYTSLALLGMFSLTAMILGTDEISGHMFAVGVVTAIWVNYPKAKK